jgi:hypothetical protein
MKNQLSQIFDITLLQATAIGSAYGHLEKLPFHPISVRYQKFYPLNIKYIPALKFFACHGLERKYKIFKAAIRVELSR